MTYELAFDERRRPRAGKVRFSTDVPLDFDSRRPSALPIFWAALFMVLVGAIVFAGRLPMTILIVYFGVSAVAFAAYAIDKFATRKGRRRTPESTLHLFALLGGWPGALPEQRIFRHKSSKPAFQRMFWITVALNCVGLGWLLTEQGSAFLTTL